MIGLRCLLRTADPQLGTATIHLDTHSSHVVASKQAAKNKDDDENEKREEMTRGLLRTIPWYRILNKASIVQTEQPT